MKKKSKTGMIQAAIVGSVMIALVLVFGTIWMGKSASSDTGVAVRNVSLLYLDELAGRREQVVSSKLEDYVKDLDVAIGLMEKDDLASVENLQKYQARMKQLYGLEKFAFVDENGLIYTSRGTRTDIDLYDFDHENISEPEISIKNVDGENKKVIIAVPVDRFPLENHTLLVCFMEIDMERFLDVLSLKTENNNTTFCNLYTKDGNPLTDAVLGGHARENNLLDALESATFEKGYSIEGVREDFSSSMEGVVSFSYDGINETLCYEPVHGTDWMLTYLIRESVISEQISTISDGIIKRSLVQSVFTAIVLFSVFGVMIRQTRKATKLTMEQETSELMQQELEERIALQDELLEQERQRAQQDSMITALASDYRSVYYVNLDEDEGICYRKDENQYEGIKEGDSFHYRHKLSEYANQYVTEQYRDAFLKFIDPEAIREGLKDKEIISMRYLVKQEDGEKYEMLKMAGVRQPDDRKDGKVHAVGIGFSDIDVEMRDELAKNQALSDALNTAEEASRAKTVFLSNMSHEIRTPMNAIIGLDSLALHEPNLPAGTRDYLEKIGSSARHLLNLINDILDMSRIESGRMVIRNEEFSFSKLIEQVNTIFSGQCKEKGLSYNCRIVGNLNDYYIGDSMKLKQVLINILGNAVKFTPEGGTVELHVQKTADFDGKTTIRFDIRDTGIGMSPEFIPKLFDTFSQESTKAVNRYGSSGLGMAITKNIVEMMNGRIEVASEKGKGSTFTVTVTLTDSERISDMEDEEIEIRPEEMSVLVIDDDPVACDHAGMVLGQIGIAADIAMSGKEALEKVKLRHARSNPYNLIIVDWQMPEMDGVETARTIRNETGDESAIIILTAYSWDDILDEATEAGVDSFVAKPLFIGSLLEEFKTALKKKQEAEAARQKKAELKGRRVLLAEDMLVNAEIMLKVLEMKEIEADHAENGKLAVEKFASSPEGYYDVILMDVRMPEMSGLEAASAIRAMDREDAKTIPIIALTANAFDEDVQRSLQAGMNAHLSKPVQPEVLFETLKKYCEP